MKTHFLSSIRHIALTALIAAASAATSNAAIVLDTTALTDTGTQYIKGPGGFLPYAEVGFTLHVPLSSDYQLDSISISFDVATSTTSSLELAAFSTGVGTPEGTLLGTFSGPTNPSGAIATYTPDTAIMLAADTDVFFRLIVPVSGGFYRIDKSTDMPGPSDWSFGDLYIGNGTDWTANAGTPLIQVSATSVPEPGSIALLGASGLFLIRRRRC